MQSKKPLLMFYKFSTVDVAFKDMRMQILIDAQCSNQKEVTESGHCGEHLDTLRAAYECDVHWDKYEELKDKVKEF